MKKRKCNKGYSCGSSCINVKLECKKGLTGQSVDIADRLASLLATASEAQESEPVFDSKKFTKDTIKKFHKDMKNGLLENHADDIFGAINKITKEGAEQVSAQHKPLSPEWQKAMKELDGQIDELRGAFDSYNKPKKEEGLKRTISDEGFNKKLGEGFFGEVFSNGKGQALKKTPANEILRAAPNHLELVNNNVKNSVDIQNLIADAGFAPRVLGYEVDDQGASKILMEELQGYKTLTTYTTGVNRKKMSPKQRDSVLKNLELAKESFVKNKARHNDLHPDNLMVNDAGDIKIIDYDFADIKRLSKQRMKKSVEKDFSSVESASITIRVNP